MNKMLTFNQWWEGFQSQWTDDLSMFKSYVKLGWDAALSLCEKRCDTDLAAVARKWANARSYNSTVTYEEEMLRLVRTERAADAMITNKERG